MPRADYKTCRHCGQHVDDVGPVSWTRQCTECSTRRFRENADGIHYHTGPAFHRWRQSLAASVGAVLVDDLREKA